MEQLDILRRDQLNYRHVCSTILRIALDERFELRGE
jgi:hypothetical protein